MAKAIGYNADVAAVSSNKFMTSLRSFGLMAGMARDKIGLQPR
ncbi:bacteriophage protein [Klebsiella pneumoniae]|uniref:Bacteriophage protein n=1 Tax=Klebsiella pneumoniae TaxID=573 RepID=A0A377TPC6_KLEPN|nr:bacteriophage protein [Klebsiella pneumoniae]